MKGILNYLFGKRKDGKCRSWDHDYGPLEKVDASPNASQFLMVSQHDR
jgi:hypothetical protein